MVWGSMAFFSFHTLVYAQPVPPAGGSATAPTQSAPAAGGSFNTKIENPLKGINSLEQLILALVDVAVKLGSILAVLAVIWVGFLYVAARGNSNAITDAHQAALYTAIGIAILFGAKVIVEIIKGTLAPLAPGLFP